MSYSAPPVRFRKPALSSQEIDAQVRQALVDAIVRGANPPDFAQLASARDLQRDEVCSSFQRLAQAGEITLWPDSHSIRLIPPFGAGSGDVTVGGALGSGGARNWRTWGLWHALGLPAALAGVGIAIPHVMLHIRDPEGGEPVSLELSETAVVQDPGEAEVVALLTIPFARWWNDPAVAISAVTPVDSVSPAAVDGVVIPLQQLWQLARRWYPDRLRPNWRPHTATEASALTESVGLHGPEWQIHP